MAVMLITIITTAYVIMPDNKPYFDAILINTYT